MGHAQYVNINNVTDSAESQNIASSHTRLDTCQNDVTPTISENNYDFDNLKIVSYNVDGLLSKLQDFDFIHFIESYDVVCLLETYMCDNVLPKHMFKSFLPVFFYPAILSPGYGRNSGGIIILVKLKYKNIVSRIESDFHGSIVLLFKDVFEGERNDLILISSYIHPYGSTFYCNLEDKNGINLFEHSFFKLYNTYKKAEFIISGDFNARIGDTQPFEDLQVAEKYMGNVNSLSFFDSFDYESLSRLSEDKTINLFGKSFCELIASFNLIVLNGLRHIDDTGCFTFISPTGNSVVDYFLVSETLMNYSINMTIPSRTESFHMPICLCFELPARKRQILK